MLPRSFSIRDLLRSLNVHVVLALAFVVVGCGSEDGPSNSDPSDAGQATCPPGTLLLGDGGCQPAGLPPELPPCPPGETPIDDACQSAGVPPGACGQGFEADGQAGCSPILPEGACPRGQMAVPGDLQCHEVAPCGDGDYGMIPVEATTEFVNAAYPGSDSDGTRARPWKHIQEGIDHARSGVIVAVAAGTYPEDVQIQGKSVRVWGRCPALVEVAGRGTQIATVQVLRGRADHAEVHSLAITGPGVGFGTSGASALVVDSVWIHDTTGSGLHAEGAFGPTSVTLSASLIEATAKLAVAVVGSDATIEATVVRSTQPLRDGTGGRGIELIVDPMTHVRSTLTLRTSLVEQNRDIGVSVGGGDATIEATVVRATQPRGDGTFGYGIGVKGDPDTHARSTLTLRTSLVEQNHDVGVAVIGSDATVEATVVRATQLRGDGTGGNGMSIYNDNASGERSTLALRASLVEQNHEIGVTVIGSDATIEATVVRATQPHRDGTVGSGIQTQIDEASGERSTLALRASLVEQNHEIGVAVVGSDATIEATVVRATQPRPDGTLGRGIEVGDGTAAHGRSRLTLRNALVEENHDVGVAVFGSDATIESTVVRATQPSHDGTKGSGVVIQNYEPTEERSTLMLRASLVEENHESGVMVFGSDATIESTVVRATQPRPDGLYGDGIDVDSDGLPITATIRSTRVEDNARVGIGNFGASVLLVASAVQCNRINLEGEGGPLGQSFAFDGSKGNLCGCEDRCGCEDPDPTCPVLSAMLSPPDPISPTILRAPPQP